MPSYTAHLRYIETSPEGITLTITGFGGTTARAFAARCADATGMNVTDVYEATEDEGPSERRVDLIESITADEWDTIAAVLTVKAPQPERQPLQHRLGEIGRLTHQIEDEAPR